VDGQDGRVHLLDRDTEVAPQMRLSKLTLAGFKSFADRTEFTFDEEVTGVVGPNGCGKSNIVDSIKWVLGERSSKSLRGKEMIDVIFAGSAGRKPSGMASVTLTFENPIIDAEGEVVDLRVGDDDDPLPPPGSRLEERPALAAAADREGDEVVETTGAAGETPAPPVAAERSLHSPAPHRRRKRRGLPIEADMVEVERRLYRDGTSKYLINGKNARLKDIRDLFLDTGIGADAYSIIEQGKVDAMLLASPQERRTIFEEAAGIAKYKQRRIEAQRKLEKAQANLSLTREQLANTERRLRIVKGQAVKARRFKELDSELKATRLALAFDQYDDIRQRLEGLTSRITELEGARTAATERLAHLEGAKQEAELARHEVLKEHRQYEEQRTAARHAEQTASQRKSMTERVLEDAKRQSQADASRLEGLESRIAGLGRAAEEQAQIIASVSERLAEAEREVSRLTQERAGVLEKRAVKQSALAERRAAAANIDRERAGLLASIEADKRREESLREQMRKVQERAEGLATEGDRLQQASDAASAAVAARREAIALLESELGEHDRTAASLSRGRGELAQRVAGLEQHVLRIDSRRTTLQEMVESRLGLGEAVRDVLEARDSGRGFAAVIAPLADLIDTDRDHAAAVEAALGHHLQALVVPSVANMPGAADLESLTGRVTFLPLAGLSTGSAALPARPADVADLQAAGRATRLRDVVGLRPAEEDQGPLAEAESDLLDRLLGRTWLVQDLDGAMMLAGMLPGARFVTRNGHIMEADGRVQAGPLSGAGGEPAGMLQRRSELVELESELARLSVDLEVERAQLKAADAEAAALAAAQAELRSRLAAEQRQIVGDQARLEQLAGQMVRLDRDRKHLGEEIQQLTGRISKAEEDRARLKERADKLAALHAEQSQLATELEAEVQKIAQAVEAHNEQMTVLRVDSSRLSEQLGGARREHRRLESGAEAAQREQRDLQRLLEQSQARLAEHDRAIQEALLQIEQARTEVAALDEQVNEAASRMAEANALAHRMGEDVNQARQHAQHVERDWHSLEVARRELEVKRENLEERTTQEMELDLVAEYPHYREMMEPGDVLRIDQAEAAAEIDVLRAEIRKLGSVNLEAIEEENQLEARNEELIRQVADIDQATTKLTELITTLNQASRERFGEVFTRIQEHFAGQNGMFRKLFGGGRAEVRLMSLVKEVETPDGIRKVETGEVDLLESGIEVIAKPPGKEPRSISQLSGGEKTLTAVALLLAIFQSKPSCFCVLDEVDAALDDANVGRYASVIREFTNHSHFIVITHNKKTMQATDRLYGITMQERGVSTRVSVRFEQVGRNGEITVSSDQKEKRDRSLPEATEEATADDPPVTVVMHPASNGVNGHARAESPPVPGAKSDLLRRALAGMRDSNGTPVES
jgi:chromosome segregation protein